MTRAPVFAVAGRVDAGLGGILVGLALVGMLGCVGGPAPGGPGGGPGTSRSVIGTLRIDGPNVRVRGAPARDGEAIRDGDSVTTGPASSARVEFSAGGFVQLDENTDPGFTLIQRGLCILVQVFTGQIFVDSGNTCVQVEDPNGRFLPESQFNLQVTRQGTVVVSVLTVRQGRVRVTSRRPEGGAVTLVSASQQIVVRGGGVGQPRTLSTQEFLALTAWRAKYFRPILAPIPGRRPTPTIPIEPPPPVIK